ncbi:MAG: hypothetical protein HRT66_03550 [Flavobacteriaceae bacterium]|nr:hypothetical protein [Flavobacteriaceae bacterium]
MKKFLILLFVLINIRSYSQEFFFGDSHIHKPEIISIGHNNLISEEIRYLILKVPDNTIFPMTGIDIKLGPTTKIYQEIDGVYGTEIIDFSAIEFNKNIPNIFKAVSFDQSYGYIYSLTVLSNSGTQLSIENSILSFKITNTNNSSNTYTCLVDNASNTITVDIPSNVNLSDYKYVMTFSDNADVSPINNSTVFLDASNQATITVTSQSGIDRTYTLTANISNNSLAEITKIRIEDSSNSNKFFETDITSTGATTAISIDITTGLDISNYKYIITHSEGSTTIPANNDSVGDLNTSNYKSFGVTSQDRARQNIYNLTINRVEDPTDTNAKLAKITHIRIEDMSDSSIYFETYTDSTGDISPVSLNVTTGLDISNYKYILTHSDGSTTNPINNSSVGDLNTSGSKSIQVTSNDQTNVNTYNLAINRVEIIKRIVSIDKPITLAYFPCWRESWPSEFGNSKLREIPSYVNTIFLSFAKPNMRYEKGSYDISATGIQTPYGGFTLLESINALNNKGIKVILSVGGETYWVGGLAETPNADCFDINYQHIKDFLDDFNIAGIDWDYEPNGQISILSEQFHINKFIEFITKSRAIMPKGEYLIACAPSGVGALGGVGPIPTGVDDPDSPYNNDYGVSLGDIHSTAGAVGTSPATLFGFASSGHFIPVMKAVGDKIDIVAYQGYNVGGSIDRVC